MSSEMLSGPELGGGYLHQLSVDTDREATTFTFHAQDGGSDAGGPPKGPLDVFGFARTPAPCMFGGPRCWHRRFLLGRRDAGRVRAAYHRNRFVLEAMLAQRYDSTPKPVPVADGLREIVRRLSAPLAEAGIAWYIGGSTAAWLQGAELAPHDIDLGTSRAGVDRIASLLGEYLIEPVGPTDWPRSGIVHGARAFVGTFHQGVRVEWAVPLEPRPPLPFEEWSGRDGVARLGEVPFEGHALSVTRPEYALVRAAEKGATRSVAAIADVVRRTGPDRELLAALLERSPLSGDARSALSDVIAIGR